MWYTAEITEDLKQFARRLGCEWIGYVKVDPSPAFEKDDCHNNVIRQVLAHGGEQVIGWYFLEGFGTYQAIRHSVWKDNCLIDVTPYVDEIICFGISRNQIKDFTLSNWYSQSLGKYLKQETEMTYYVYELVDPRTDQPFYIGKGKGNRAYVHLSCSERDRNSYKEAKINKIRSQGLEPQVRYIAENIIDEELAYEIEKQMIKKYGRKGYDEGGILTNICEDNRPPNHRGKKYEEIYGPERAKEQRELRSRLQKERGGYGPKKHSVETRAKISAKSSGEGNGMWGRQHSDEAKQKISEANTGRKASDEERAKRSKRMKEIYSDPVKGTERREKISRAIHGVPKNEDHKRKISESNNKYWIDVTKDGVTTRYSSRRAAVDDIEISHWSLGEILRTGRSVMGYSATQTLKDTSRPDKRVKQPQSDLGLN